MRYSKVYVSKITTKIVNAVKESLANNTYSKCDNPNTKFPVYHIRIQNISKNLTDVFIALLDVSNCPAGTDIDDEVFNACGGHFGAFVKSRNLIITYGWCINTASGWKLGNTFYKTIGHEVNHFCQYYYYKTNELPSKMRPRYEYVTKVMKTTKNPIKKANFYIEYRMFPNEVDSNVQGFAYALEAAHNAGDPSGFVENVYNIQMNEINGLKSLINKNTKKKFIHSIDLYERRITNLYNKAVADFA